MARTSGKIEEITSPDAKDLNAQMNALKADISGLTDIITEMGKAKAHEVTQAGRVTADKAMQKGADQAEQLKQNAVDLQDQANDFIAKQPATALAIAAGAGFLIGFLSSRR